MDHLHPPKAALYTLSFTIRLQPPRFHSYFLTSQT
jgi:hypothetical protein